MLLSFMAVWSVGAVAQDIGVVDMKVIFKTSPKAKDINKSLKDQFSSRKTDIVEMGKTLQKEVQQYRKNRSVMNKKNMRTLQGKIQKQSIALRKAQVKFQSDLATAQNKKMKVFIAEVKAAVKKVSRKKDLDVVLPSNAVLYSSDKLDVTSDVLSAMK